MKFRLKYSLLFLSLLWFLPLTGYGQQSYTMNFLNQVPQQSKLNPAYYTCYKLYVGVPGLSAVQLQINNDALSIARSVYRVGDTAFIDYNSIISSLSPNNNFGVDISADILSFGLKVREKNQFHFALSVEGYTNLLVTKSAFNVLFEGPGFFLDNKDESDALSENSIDMSVYGALSFGYARMVNDKLSVGARVKFLSGLTNLYTERSDIRISIDNGDNDTITPYTYFITPNVSLMGSFANAPKDSDLFHALENIGSTIGFPNSPFSNPGIGFDFGATYHVSDVFTLGASIRDIGFIKWNTGVKRIFSEGETKPFAFSGVRHFNDILNDNDFDVNQVFTIFKDSLISYLQLSEEDAEFSSYRSKLRTSYNISAFYNFTDDDQLGLMWNAQVGQQKSTALTFAYMRTFSPYFSVCLTNAIVNQSVFNFGGGFALNAGPVQLYVVVDKLSSFRVVNMRGVNVQFGLNVVLNRIDEDMARRRFVRDYTPRDKTGYVRDRWAF